MSVKPILYSYYRSSCAWRVRTALAIKGVDYVYRAVNISPVEGKQHSVDFKKINPLSQVPALVVNDNEVLIESMAIIDYINETYSGPSIFPKDPILRAKSRGIAETITTGIQPLQNLSVLEKINQADKDLGDSSQWAKSWIEDKFVGLEKLLDLTSGQCCVGNDITIADICLVPQVFNANRFGVDMSKFPTISRINAYLSENESFKRSHPFRQPDCPQQYRISE